MVGGKAWWKWEQRVCQRKLDGESEPVGEGTVAGLSLLEFVEEKGVRIGLNCSGTEIVDLKETVSVLPLWP